MMLGQFALSRPVDHAATQAVFSSASVSSSKSDMPNDFGYVRSTLR
jgi:hypothetical protein